VEYFLGTLVAAYNDFEARVGTISSAKGAKRELVKNAVEHLLLLRFTVGERLQRDQPDDADPRPARLAGSGSGPLHRARSECTLGAHRALTPYMSHEIVC
jgi:hypothetical protein